MSETTPSQGTPAFSDPASCEHPQWVPFRKRLVVQEPMLGMLTSVFAWCPRCNTTRPGPAEEGM